MAGPLKPPDDTNTREISHRRFVATGFEIIWPLTTNYGIFLSCHYLSVCIEDLDPLHRHKEINFSSGGSFSVRALCSRTATNRSDRSNKSMNLVTQRKSELSRADWDTDLMTFRGTTVLEV